MFRVLYGIRDKEVKPTQQSGDMFSANTHGTTAGARRPASKTASNCDHAADIRFSGFAFRQNIEEQTEPTEDVWITLNIGGCVFTTTTKTLQKHPAERLNKMAEDSKDNDEKPKEHKFDRNASMFSFILDYMRTGELHVPHDTCTPYFRQELEFWGIRESVIAECCWPRYKSYDEENEMLEKVRKHFLTDLDHYQLYIDSLPSDAYVESCRWKTWMLLEYPYSSVVAKLWAVMYVLFVLISIFCLIVDTHEDFRVDGSSDRLRNNAEQNSKILLRDTTDPHPAISYLDLLTTLVFSVEILLRFCVCPDKKAFFKSFLNWMDLFSLVAQWIIFGLSSAGAHYWDSDALWRLFEACSVIRVFRVFRIFRLAKHYTGLQILVLALQASARELIFLAMFVAVGMLIFATFIFYAEFKTKDIFLSIPESFWWAIITMTTVGYGDAYPMTGWGYFVGSICALCGIVTIGLPIPIIATNFKIFYDYANLTQRMKSKETLTKNLSISKLKGKLLKFKKDKNNDDGKNNGKTTRKRTTSRSSLASNSSKKSKNSKVYPVDDQPGANAADNPETRPQTNITLERSDSEERNDLVATNDSDKTHLVSPKKTGKSPKPSQKSPSKQDSYPLVVMNNLNLADNTNTNTNNSGISEKEMNKELNETSKFDAIPEKEEITIDPRNQKPAKPAPPPRTSSLTSPSSNQTRNDINDLFAPPGYSRNPSRNPSQGLTGVEADQPHTPRTPLPPIQRQPSRPATSRGKKPKKKVEKKRRGFMMF